MLTRRHIAIKLIDEYLASVVVALLTIRVIVAPGLVTILLAAIHPVVVPVVAVLFGLNKCDIADLRCRPSCDNPDGSGRKLRQL